MIRKIFFIFVFIFLISSLAYAHRVNIFCDRQGDCLSCEGYFSNGSPSQKSKVEVYSQQDKLLAEGITDDEGVCNLKVDYKGKIKIVLKLFKKIHFKKILNFETFILKL